MTGYINIDSLCWELESIMKNNFHGDVTKKNFKSTFNQAKKQILEDLEEVINQNEITMKEEFNIIKKENENQN